MRAEGEFQHVSNLALGEAALLLQFSHSRYAIDLFFRATAGGSYSTLRRTLGQLAVEPFILPSNDIAIGINLIRVCIYLGLIVPCAIII